MSSSDSSSYDWTLDEFDNLSIASYLSPGRGPSALPVLHPSGNPFLAPGDVTAIVEPPQFPTERFHLLPFWPTWPAALFGAADVAFHLRRVTDGRDKFSYVIAVLARIS